MKRTLKCILVLSAILLGIRDVYADCTYSEKAALNQEVANIKVRYEVAEDKMPASDYICNEVDEGVEDCAPNYTYLNMNILNMNEKFYVVVNDSVDGMNNTYGYEDIDENGVISFRWEKLAYLNKFTYTVYSSEATSCPNERLRVIYQTTPKKNLNAKLEICSELPDYYLCEEFVTYEKDYGFEEFMDLATKELESQNQKKKEEEKNKSFWEKLGDFINDNKVVIIVCTAVIVVVVTGTVIVIRKRREL